MNDLLSGSEKASRVLGSAGGAAVKMAFKIDTIRFSWVDAYLRDKALRNRIKALREEMDAVMKSPIHRDELMALFVSAIGSIEQERLNWFTEKLLSVQNRTGALLNAHMLRSRDFIPAVSITTDEIKEVFSRLPEGVRQKDIDAEMARLKKEITTIEGVIAAEMSPPERWIYRDDGKPHPYPQGCRWTQYVIAWERVVSRFDGRVTVEGESIKSDYETTAYIALGLDKVGRISPLRKPLG